MTRKQLSIFLAAASMACFMQVAFAADAAQPARKLSGAALLQLDDGRGGRGNLIATTGVRGFSRPASIHAYALILTIGDYGNGIPRLTGVKHDGETASEIARRMGVPPENILRYSDSQLTLEGMRRALDDLARRLVGGDQVFIYYSGHGSRQLVEDAEGGERCAESLVSVDGQALTDSELEKRLKAIAAKAQKTIVFLDACHSGGVTTRGMAPQNAAYSPKSWTPPGKNCTKPTNVLTRGIILTKAKGDGYGGNNFVHIAAARDDEISLDQPGRGGVASQAWLYCLTGAAQDADGSGGLSAGEIRDCAQVRINQQLANAQGFLPHHVSVTGNDGMVLSYAAATSPPPPPEAAAPPVVVAAPPVAHATSAPVALNPPAPAPMPPAATPAAPPTPTPATPPPATAASKPPAAVPPGLTLAPPAAAPMPPPVAPPPAVAVSPLAALNDIYNSRDDRHLVTLKADKPTLKIGRDEFKFTLQSREGGHAYLLMVGSDGKTFDLLFPNQIDHDNLIAAGGSLSLPRPNWALSAEGPPGRNTLLAIVSDSPRDFAAAGLAPSGPFSSAAPGAAKDIQLVSAGSEREASGECKAAAKTRNLAIRKRCSTAYGAALLTIEEVR